MIYILVAIALVIFLIWYFDKENRVNRQFKNTPVSDIPACKNSLLLKVLGKVVYNQQQLIAPLSSRPCSAYCVNVTQYTIGSDDGSDRVGILTDQQQIDFLIEQNGQFVLIRTDSAELFLKEDTSYISSKLDDSKQKEFKHYLNKFDIKSKGILGFKKDLEYAEGILTEGENVAVLGEGKWYKTAEIKHLPNGLVTNQDRIFVFSASISTPLYVSENTSILSK